MATIVLVLDGLIIFVALGVAISPAFGVAAALASMRAMQLSRISDHIHQKPRQELEYHGHVQTYQGFDPCLPEYARIRTKPLCNLNPGQGLLARITSDSAPPPSLVTFTNLIPLSLVSLTKVELFSNVIPAAFAPDGYSSTGCNLREQNLAIHIAACYFAEHSGPFRWSLARVLAYLTDLRTTPEMESFIILIEFLIDKSSRILVDCRRSLLLLLINATSRIVGNIGLRRVWTKFIYTQLERLSSGRQTTTLGADLETRINDIAINLCFDLQSLPIVASYDQNMTILSTTACSFIQGFQIRNPFNFYLPSPSIFMHKLENLVRHRFRFKTFPEHSQALYSWTNPSILYNLIFEQTQNAIPKLRNKDRLKYDVLLECVWMEFDERCSILKDRGSLVWDHIYDEKARFFDVFLFGFHQALARLQHDELTPRCLRIDKMHLLYDDLRLLSKH